MIDVNYVGVVVAAIASFAVGAVWYSFLFQKPWMELMGITADSMKSMKMTPAMSMAGGFLMTLIMVYVLAHFSALIGVQTIEGALTIGFWVWLGFQLPVLSGVVLWENKSPKLLAINASHQLVATLVAAVALVLF